MIVSYRDKRSAEIAEGGAPKGFPPDALQSARRKLTILNYATSVEDLRIPPGNRLEKLKADRDGQYSIRINAHWRICFRWTDNGPDDVEIVDYH
ncbi:MAG: higA [Rhizobium sp.]|nr:higA [Rhizobium sp.]